MAIGVGWHPMPKVPGFFQYWDGAAWTSTFDDSRLPEKSFMIFPAMATRDTWPLSFSDPENHIHLCLMHTKSGTRLLELAATISNTISPDDGYYAPSYNGSLSGQELRGRADIHLKKGVYYPHKRIIQFNNLASEVTDHFQKRNWGNRTQIPVVISFMFDYVGGEPVVHSLWMEEYSRVATMRLPYSKRQPGDTFAICWAMRAVLERYPIVSSAVSASESTELSLELMRALTPTNAEEAHRASDPAIVARRAELMDRVYRFHRRLEDARLRLQ